MSTDDRSEDPIDLEDATVSVRPAVASSPVSVGRVIASKYVVREILGRGGMGVVVRAHHLALDQPVALKFLLGATPTASVRFQREARIVFQLSGEHVVRLFDVGTLDDGAPYLVMELVQGETLAQRLAREGPLPIPVAIDFVLQALVGVAEAHRAAIVHRDLKPSNLMLTTGADGAPLVKVLDFGIAKIVGPLPRRAERDGSPPSIGAARLGVADTVSKGVPAPAAPPVEVTAIAGSPHYMSPEQIERPADVDVRSDVWAIGVVLHELATGKVPFDGASITEVASKIREGVPTLALDASDDRALEAVLRRCLSRAPADRFQDVGELALALAPLGNPATAQALADRVGRVLARPPSSIPEPIARTFAEPETPAANASRRAPRYGVWVGVAVAIPLAVVLVSWLATRRTDPTVAGDRPAVPLAASTELPGTPHSSLASSASASVVKTCAAGMILVPAGTFTMGLPKGEGFDRASPERQVKLGAYCIDRTEVTVEAYQRCVETKRGALQCTPARTVAEFRAAPPNEPVTIDQCNAGIPERANHPINCIDWLQAATYCKWVTNGRGDLPTEAQWERAARGTDKRKYPWGEDKPSVLLVNGNDEDYRAWRTSAGLKPPKPYYPGSDGFTATAPVGSFPRDLSPVGALDMAGNVSEWMADYWALYDRTALVDPRRARDSKGKDAHVIRGGAWPDNKNETTFRTAFMSNWFYPDLGVRCAAPPE